MVGRNNAGKSTITEALRLVSIITSRYGSLSFQSVPHWLYLARSYRGVSPSLKGLDFNDLSIFHKLGDPPAKIEAIFDNGFSIEIYLGREATIFAVIRDKERNMINSKAIAQMYRLPSVSILPQIGPLMRQEKIIADPDYVKRLSTTPLASLHFRNQLRLNEAALDEFFQLARSTWPSLKRIQLEGAKGLPGDDLALLIEDGDFFTEVAWMGHGLQMWLQTMWFLALHKESETIILDEPDVYMHADLQRKLVRLLRGRHPQIIIATHSVEIISEADPNDILIIERDSAESKFATSLPAVQHALDSMGSIHNLHLTRLWGSQKLLNLEGKDLKYLKVIQDKISPNTIEPIDTIPNMQIGGWGGWPYAIGSKLLLKNAFSESIMAYCILDRDYHTPSQISSRLEEAKQKGISLHIWDKKEIENYFVVPDAILRIILNELPTGLTPPTVKDINKVIQAIADQEHDKLIDLLATEYQAEDKPGGVSKANPKARDLVKNAWKTLEGKQSLVPGKELIAKLSQWSQSKYKVSLSPIKILREMERREIHSELTDIVKKIEKGQPF
jgi:hypothetical protein